MSELVEKIRAELDKDESAANDLTAHLLNGGELGFDPNDLPDVVRRHILRWTQARVERQVVAAMRKILDRIELVLTAGEDLKDERGVLVSVPIARYHARAMLADLAEALGIEP